MLVLSRKINEAIVINDNITIKIIAVKGDRIRLGIEAPSDVSVNRAEVQARRTQFIDVPVTALVCGESVDLGGLPHSTSDDTAH